MSIKGSLHCQPKTADTKVLKPSGRGSAIEKAAAATGLARGPDSWANESPFSNSVSIKTPYPRHNPKDQKNPFQS
jgi:hypothetical protein